MRLSSHPSLWTCASFCFVQYVQCALCMKKYVGHRFDTWIFNHSFTCLFSIRYACRLTCTLMYNLWNLLLLLLLLLFYYIYVFDVILYIKILVNHFIASTRKFMLKELKILYFQDRMILRILWSKKSAMFFSIKRKVSTAIQTGKYEVQSYSLKVKLKTTLCQFAPKI